MHLNRKVILLLFFVSFSVFLAGIQLNVESSIDSENAWLMQNDEVRVQITFRTIDLDLNQRRVRMRINSFYRLQTNVSYISAYCVNWYYPPNQPDVARIQGGFIDIRCPQTQWYDYQNTTYFEYHNYTEVEFYLFGLPELYPLDCYLVNLTYDPFINPIIEIDEVIVSSLRPPGWTGIQDFTTTPDNTTVAIFTYERGPTFRNALLLILLFPFLILGVSLLLQRKENSTERNRTQDSVEPLQGRILEYRLAIYLAIFIFPISVYFTIQTMSPASVRTISLAEYLLLYLLLCTGFFILTSILSFQYDKRIDVLAPFLCIFPMIVLIEYSQLILQYPMLYIPLELLGLFILTAIPLWIRYILEAFKHLSAQYKQYRARQLVTQKRKK